MDLNSVLLIIFAFAGIFIVNLIRFKIPVIVQSMKIDETFPNMTQADESFVLGSYFYGYVVSQIPLSILGKCISNGKIFGVMMLLTGCTNIFIYFAANPYQVGAARVIIGLFQGGSYPLIHGIWHEIASEKNLSNLVSIEYAGGGFGSFLSPILAVYLIEAFAQDHNSNHLGWKITFLLSGIICIIFSILWLIFFNNLEKSGKIKKTSTNFQDIKENALKIPWLSILSSLPFWGLVIPQICSNYGSYSVQLLTVKYLSTYFNFDFRKAGMLSSLPVLAKPVCCILVGYLSMKIIKVRKQNDNRLVVRKTISWIMFCGTSIAFITTIFLKKSLIGCMICLTLVMGFDGFGPAAFKANIIEIAPSLAGIVFAVANTFGNFPGFIAPIVAGTILEKFEDNVDLAWTIIFLETGVVCIVGALVFHVLGTVEQQIWDDYRKDDVTKKDVEMEKLYEVKR